MTQKLVLFPVPNAASWQSIWKYLDYFLGRGRTYKNVECQFFDDNNQGRSERKAQDDGEPSPRLRA